MAKLTLSFKGRLLAVHHLERPVLTIGRDPDCDIVIDSLAVAERHAEIRQDGATVALVALDPEHPVYRNGERVAETVLADGDLILVGKHTLDFSEAAPEAILLPRATSPQRPRRDEPPDSVESIPVYLQIQSGPHIGQVIPLIRAVTRLTLIGGHEVIVTRRDGGYLLARIGEANRVFVGQRTVAGDEEIELVDGDPVEIDGTICRFFCPEDPDAQGS
jgi:pSer/pThr/pTyr-binding forkhead associated (FHA) protein